MSTLKHVIEGAATSRLDRPIPLTAEEEAALAGDLADVADPGEALRDG